MCVSFVSFAEYQYNDAFATDGELDIVKCGHPIQWPSQRYGSQAYVVLHPGDEKQATLPIAPPLQMVSTSINSFFLLAFTLR